MGESEVQIPVLFSNCWIMSGGNQAVYISLNAFVKRII